MDSSEVYATPFDLTIESYNGTDCAHIVVPEGVVRIADGAFAKHGEIVSCSLPSTLASIGSQAFSGCSALQGIDIPDSVTEIGHSAFLNCTDLEEVRLSDNVETLPRSVFSHCRSLKALEGGRGVRRLGVGAFRSCGQLAGIPFADNLLAIDRGALSRCSSLAHMRLPQEMEHIGREAFKGCSGLDAIELPLRIEKMDKDVFEDCGEIEFSGGFAQLLERFPDAFPRKVVEATGRIRPQDRWDKARRFRAEHADMIAELEGDIEAYRQELATSAYSGRAIPTKDDYATEKRRDELEELIADAEDLLETLKRPSWETLVEYYCPGE